MEQFSKTCFSSEKKYKEIGRQKKNFELPLNRLPLNIKTF